MSEEQNYYSGMGIQSNNSQSFPNTSGQGSNAQVPEEIKRWNWGAFLLSWIWGIAHGVWLSLLALVPYAGLIMAIILGIKGNEWAWQAQHYNSIEEFKEREHRWSVAGFIVFIVMIVMIILFMSSIAAIFSSIFH